MTVFGRGDAQDCLSRAKILSAIQTTPWHPHNPTGYITKATGLYREWLECHGALLWLLGPAYWSKTCHLTWLVPTFTIVSLGVTMRLRVRLTDKSLLLTPRRSQHASKAGPSASCRYKWAKQMCKIDKSFAHKASIPRWQGSNLQK